MVAVEKRGGERAARGTASAGRPVGALAMLLLVRAPSRRTHAASEPRLQPIYIHIVILTSSITQQKNTHRARAEREPPIA